jgi:hypothetical protein
MARIAAACLASSGIAAPAWAGHAPPPPIVLRPAPPPDLSAPEPLRPPFELAPELRLGLPSCSTGSTTSQRCSGLGAGPGAGLTLLWRPTPYFAVGGTFDLEAFQAPRARGENARGHFVGLLGRVYFFEQASLEPSLELGFGEGSFGTRESESGLESSEVATGVAVRVGGALEYYLGRRVRLGPALTWTRFAAEQLRRCAGSACSDLEPGAYGHGTGFLSVALRLSVLLGPSS